MSSSFSSPTSRVRRFLRLSAAPVVLFASISIATPANAAEIVVIEGRGFGHGVGMSQDGAFWMGVAGRTSTDILRTYYPGTTIGKRSGRVKVPFKGGIGRVELPDGGRIGSTVLPPGAVVSAAVNGNEIVVRRIPGAVASHPTTSTTRLAATVSRAAGAIDPSPGLGRYGAVLAQEPPATVVGPAPQGPAADPVLGPSETAPPLTVALPPDPTTPTGEPAASAPSTPPTIAASTTTTAPPVGRGSIVLIDAGRKIFAVGGERYRGALELRLDGGLRVFNDLDIEDYLRGMGEITFPKWPGAAHEAQAIVARTYALLDMSEEGFVCATQACQVYHGVEAEYPEMDAAVARTAGQVVLWEGKLAKTFYSASDGGHSATPEEGFGGGAEVNAKYPYLLARPTTSGDVRAWEVRMPLADLGRRFGYRGSVDDIVVSDAGPSGRVLQVSIVGESGTKPIDGITFRKQLGLRSGLFSFRIEDTSVASPQPPADPADALSAGALDVLPGLPPEPVRPIVTTIGGDRVDAPTPGALATSPAATVALGPGTTTPAASTPVGAPTAAAAPAAATPPAAAAAAAPIGPNDQDDAESPTVTLASAPATLRSSSGGIALMDVALSGIGFAGVVGVAWMTLGRRRRPKPRGR